MPEYIDIIKRQIQKREILLFEPNTEYEAIKSK